MTLPAGTRLGRYRVLGPLGAGGMGEVYRARDERLGRDVAVKVLPAGSEQDHDAVARFERESRAVAALSHPNILAIHDVGWESGRTYAVTELLEGEDLRARLGAGPLPADEASAIAGCILDGLAAAHAKGIVHRDIKPGNVFLAADGQVKILDFGLARVTEARAHPDEPTQTEFRTTTGAVLGTLAYMAPEQLKGEPVDARADLFSFGCVLYEMLAGARPFAGETPLEAATSILRDRPELGRVPAPFREVVGRCLEKERDRRPASAREVRASLRPPAAADPTATTLLPSAGRERRWPVRLAVAAALLVLAAIATALLLRGGSAPMSAGRIDSLAVLPLVNLSGDPAQEYFADGMTDTLTAELSQIAALRVISRTSVMQFKGTRLAMPEIARELGVRGLIEGSVVRAGDRIRIIAQLIDGPGDRHLWAKTYEREVTDVLSLQSEIATAIAREVGAVLTPAEAARLSRPQSVDARALELYLKGKAELALRTRESLLGAVGLFERATEIDPSFAAAWAGVATAHALLGDNGHLPVSEVRGPARAAADRALAIDPASAEAHAALGFILYRFERDWEGAGAALRRAIELEPSLATAHQFYGAWLIATNRREEGLRNLERAVTLDPFAARSRTVYANHLYFSGRFAEARREAERSLPNDPSMANQVLSDLAASEGNFAEARARASLCCGLDARRQLAQMAYLTALEGDPAAARRQLARAEAQGSSQAAPLLYIKAFTAAGDLDSAFALASPEHGAPFMVSHPAFQTLRQDPRFRQILRLAKLDPYY